MNMDKTATDPCSLHSHCSGEAKPPPLRARRFGQRLAACVPSGPVSLVKASPPGLLAPRSGRAWLVRSGVPGLLRNANPWPACVPPGPVSLVEASPPGLLAPRSGHDWLVRSGAPNPPRNANPWSASLPEPALAVHPLRQSRRAPGKTVGSRLERACSASGLAPGSSEPLPFPRSRPPLDQAAATHQFLTSVRRAGHPQQHPPHGPGHSILRSRPGRVLPPGSSEPLLSPRSRPPLDQAAATHQFLTSVRRAGHPQQHRPHGPGHSILRSRPGRVSPPGSNEPLLSPRSRPPLDQAAATHQFLTSVRRAGHPQQHPPHGPGHSILRSHPGRASPSGSNEPLPFPRSRPPLDQAAARRLPLYQRLPRKPRSSPCHHCDHYHRLCCLRYHHHRSFHLARSHRPIETGIARRTSHRAAGRPAGGARGDAPGEQPRRSCF
jgi:hypothetical protein